MFRELKIGNFGWKTVVFIKSGVQEVQRAQNRQFCMENSCFYKIRVLGCPGSLKSAILDGKQLFLLNQVFRRSRQLKIGFFRWKTAVFIKSGVQEVQRAQNRQFQIENSCFYKIRFLAGSRKLKIGNFGWKRLCLFNQLFKRSREPKIGYLKRKTAVFII